MKAIVQDVYGPPNALALKEIDQPVVKDGDVLVRVHAAAVNFADWLIMGGSPYLLRIAGFGLRGPKTKVRGTDVAGVVEAVGKDVRHLKPGDEVFGSCQGAFAEYACAAADNLVLKPAGLTFQQAAAVPMAALTALQALRDQGKVQPGQQVLINGVSGGIGTFAVQIAKAFGAEVTGVCSTRNADLVRSIGADHVIDYTREDFTRGGQQYDLILDNVANHSLSDCRRVLTSKGTFIPNSGLGGRWVGSAGRLVGQVVASLFVSQRVRPFVSTTKNVDLVVLKELIESGQVTPVIDRTYPISEAPEAIGYVGAGHARGKVVIAV
jgi:NADPH:quinone reductase-like Zn-dependent oxidoreductase